MTQQDFDTITLTLERLTATEKLALIEQLARSLRRVPRSPSPYPSATRYTACSRNWPRCPSRIRPKDGRTVTTISCSTVTHDFC